MTKTYGPKKLTVDQMHSNAKDAKAAGHSHYFTGKPCKKDHIVPRNARGACLACIKVFNSGEYKKARKPHRLITPEEKAERRRAYDLSRRDKIKEYYQANKEKISKTQADYRRRNKDKIKALKQRYWEKNKDELKHKFKEYNEVNKDRLAEAYREYYEKNREIIRQKKREYYLKNREKIKQRQHEYRQRKKQESE